MSYILEALNKSEQMREAGQNLPTLSTIHQPAEKEKIPTSTTAWSLVLVLLFALGFSVYLLIDNNSTPLLPEINQAAEPETFRRERNSSSATVVPVALPERDQSSKNDSQPNLLKADISRLYQEPPSSVAITVEPLVEAGLVEAKNVKAQTYEREYANTVDDKLPPRLIEMPASFRQQLPNLEYSAHIYSSDPSSAFVVVNGSSRRAGDSLDGGVVVERIVKDGVLMSYLGKHFKLQM